MSISGLADAVSFAMAETVTIKPYLGTTGTGQRLYGPAKTYPCEVQEDQKPIFTTLGQQVVSTSTIKVYPRATDGTVLATVNVDTQITLADGTSPRIIRAGAVRDLDGGTIYYRIFT